MKFPSNNIYWAILIVTVIISVIFVFDVLCMNKQQIFEKTILTKSEQAFITKCQYLYGGKILHIDGKPIACISPDGLVDEYRK